MARASPTSWPRAGAPLPDLRHIVCGGAQPPRALIERFRDEFGIPIVQAWGMTETSPLARMAWPQEHMRDWDDERRRSTSCAPRPACPLPGVEVTHPRRRRQPRSPGTARPWASSTCGARGSIDGYLGGEGADAFTDDGWFRTGDVAIGSPDGYFVIADRTKDLIKSGGEWISSVDMEAALMAMPGVAEAAVIAVPDPKWQERPLACVVAAAGRRAHARRRARRTSRRAGFARWQLPDRIELIDEVPRTSVGKFDKKALRARFAA